MKTIKIIWNWFWTIPIGLLSAAVFFRDEFLPNKYKDQQLIELLKMPSWRIWEIIFGIVILIPVAITIIYDPFAKKWRWKKKNPQQNESKPIPHEEDRSPITLSNGDVITSVLWGIPGNMREVIHLVNRFNVNGNVYFRATVGNLLDVEHGAPNKEGIIKIKGKRDIHFKENDDIKLP